MSLDKKKPYGVVSGEHHGAFFEQDGQLFDSDGEEIVVDEAVLAVEQDVEQTAVVKKTAKQPGRKVGAKKKVAVVVQEPSPVDDQIAAQGA